MKNNRSLRIITMSAVLTRFLLAPVSIMVSEDAMQKTVDIQVTVQVKRS